MSSTPRKGAPSGPAKPERKAAAGPVVTPQVLGIFFGIIIIVGVVLFMQMVVVKFNKDIQSLNNEISGLDQRIRTYNTKKGKLDQARNLNVALREKLSLIDYLFLYNQDSVLPFWEETLLPIIEGGELTVLPGESFLEADEYTFNINMAMSPFATLPRSVLFEDVVTLFPIEYKGEQNGVEIEKVLDTQPPNFLWPYNIALVDFAGTYEDVAKFVERVQTAEDDVLMTVHCIKSDGDPWGLYRSFSKWTIRMTVYFMNPEAAASGDNPPEPPGSQTC